MCTKVSNPCVGSNMLLVPLDRQSFFSSAVQDTLQPTAWFETESKKGMIASMPEAIISNTVWASPLHKAIQQAE